MKPAPQETRKRALALLELGWTIRGAARDVGVSMETVRQWAQCSGLTVQSHQSKRSLSDAQVAALKKRRKAGATQRELAQEFGVAPSVVSLILHKGYATIPTLTRAREKRRERDGLVAAKYVVTLGGVIAGFGYLDDMDDALDRAFADCDSDTWDEVVAGTLKLAEITKRVRARRRLELLNGGVIADAQPDREKR